MKYLLPEKFHGYSGKKKGIIDTGRTVEFWCTPMDIVHDSNPHRFVIKELCRRYAIEQNKQEGMCMSIPHFVTLQQTPRLKELGVLLHLGYEHLESMVGRQKAAELPSPQGLEYLDVKQILLGFAPHNHNLHKTLSKHLHVLGRGRVHKVWVKSKPCNIKVIFPYSPYKFNNDNELVLDNAVINKDRFDDLMFDGEEDA